MGKAAEEARHRAPAPRALRPASAPAPRALTASAPAPRAPHPAPGTHGAPRPRSKKQLRGMPGTLSKGPQKQGWFKAAHLKKAQLYPVPFSTLTDVAHVRGLDTHNDTDDTVKVVDLALFSRRKRKVKLLQNHRACSLMTPEALRAASLPESHTQPGTECGHMSSSEAA